MALSDAQQAQVDALRPLLGAWDGGDDTVYALIVGAGGDLNLAAAAGWNVKAAQAGDLVDVQEGSSKRPLSQLAPLALRMAAYYRGAADAESTSGGARTTFVPIVRRTTW